MKKESVFISLICVFLTLTVSVNAVAQVSNKMMVCELSKVGKTVNIPLSSLVENCTLIKLDNDDNALFKQWFTTVTDEYIGVRQSVNAPYKLFSHSGKFIGDIGSIGNGPGEYSMLPYDDIIDDKNELVYLAPFVGKNILVYNTSGKFIKSIELPLMLHKAKIFLSPSSTLTVLHMAFHGDKAMAYQISAQGKIIKQMPAPKSLLVGDVNGEIFNSRNTQFYEFLHTSKDTLYHYDTNKNDIIPVFTIALSSSDKNFRQYFELPRHYITNVFGKGVVATDKSTGRSNYIKLVNDYYGNLEMPVSIINFRNGWFVLNIEPGQLITKIESRLKEKDCTEKDKQKLNKLLSTLDEDSNNLVFMGKLKK